MVTGAGGWDLSVRRGSYSQGSSRPCSPRRRISTRGGLRSPVQRSILSTAARKRLRHPGSQNPSAPSCHFNLFCSAASDRPNSHAEILAFWFQISPPFAQELNGEFCTAVLVLPGPCTRAGRPAPWAGGTSARPEEEPPCPGARAAGHIQRSGAIFGKWLLEASARDGDFHGKAAPPSRLGRLERGEGPGATPGA